MQKIEKTINIENFISRIPTSLPCVDEQTVLSSWGHVPYNISIYDLYPFLIKTEKDITYTYRFLIESYNELIKFFKESQFYIYDSNYDNWKLYNVYYSDAIFDEKYRGVFTYLPEDVKKDGDIICLSDNEHIEKKDRIVFLFRNDLLKVFNNTENVFKDETFLIHHIENIIGKRRVPAEIKGKLVPKHIFYNEIPTYLIILSELKQKLNKNCCNLADYNDYGGDSFYEFLLSEQQNRPNQVSTDKSLIPYINVPLLITENYKDLGLMEVYEQEDAIPYYTTKVFALSDSQMEPPTGEYANKPGVSKNKTGENVHWRTFSNGNGKWWYSEGKYDSETKKILKDENGKLEWSYPKEYKLDYSRSLSQINEFKRRKIYYDENDNELPGMIPSDGSKKLLSSYPSLFVEYKDEKGNIIDKSNELGENYVINVSENGGIVNGSQIYKTTYTFTIEDAKENETFKNIKEYKPFTKTTSAAIIGNSREDALNKANDMAEDILTLRKEELKTEIKADYLIDSSLDGALQQCQLNFTIKYNGNVEKITINDVLRLKLINTVTFIYVVGGLYNHSNGKLLLAEKPNTPSLGIWHEETFPLNVDRQIGEYFYDEIDFSKKQLTINYEGIDYQRDNVIISDKVWFNEENMSINNTNYFTFRNDQNIGLSMPFKEEINAVIERGNSSSFEKILKLNEVKTFEDLENYGNNYFNI